MPNLARRTRRSTGQCSRNYAKKRLKQLIQTEEQRTHAQQIKRANKTLQSGGGLAKVTTTTSMGTKENHYTKESIEEACLAEAKA